MIPTDPETSMYDKPIWNRWLTAIALITAPLSALSVFGGLTLLVVATTCLAPLLLFCWIVWDWWAFKR